MSDELDLVCPRPRREHERPFVASYDDPSGVWSCYEHGERLIPPERR